MEPSTPPRPSPVDRVIGGRYRLQKLLGEGGVSQVWLARDEQQKRPVALKLLRRQYARDERLLERFQREARLVAELESPHLVKIYGVETEKDPRFIVMEYVAGQDLRQYLRYNAPLSVDESLTIIREIARGVAAAHEAGFIHRDLKPANILLSREGQLKVTDFGIARHIATARVTEPGMVWGTSHYLAPEQAGGKALSPATDVYALGVILFEMLTGRLPFEGEDPVAVALAHIREPIPDVQSVSPSVPLGVAQLVRRMMDKAPERRPSDAGTLVTLLDSYLQKGGSATALQQQVEETWLPPGSSARARRTGRPRALPTPLLAFLVLGLVVVIAGLIFSEQLTTFVGGEAVAVQGTATATATPGTPTPTSGPFLLAATPPTSTPTVTPTPTLTPTPVPQRREDNGPDATASSSGAGRIVIDGNISEWSGDAVRLFRPVIGREFWSGFNDLSGQAWFAYDENYLYMAVERIDDRHVLMTTQTGADLYRGDAVELWIDADLQGDFDEAVVNGSIQDDFHFGFSAGDFQLSGLRPEPIIFAPEARAGLSRELRVRALPTADGYTLEVRIPWSLMEVTPEPGLMLGYAVVLNDNDTPSENDFQTQIASNEDVPYRRPDTFGNLILR